MQNIINVDAPVSQNARLLNRIWSIVAGLTPTITFFAPKATTPALILLALLGIGSLQLNRQSLSRLSPLVLWSVVAFCGWGFISLIWAIDARIGFVGELKVIGNLIVLAVVVQTISAFGRTELKWLATIMLGGWCLTALFLAIEVIFGDPIYELLRGPEYTPRANINLFWLNAVTGLLILLALPLADYAARTWGRLYGALVVSAVLLISIGVGYRSGTIAIVCGILALGLVKLFGRRGVIALAAASLVFSIALPLIPAQLGEPAQAAEKMSWLPNSAQHRVAIWTFTTKRIVERPFLGWGMNAARNIPGGKTMLTYSDGSPIGDALPLHPHNTALQLWLELGLPGLLFYAACLLFLFRFALRRTDAAALVAAEIIVVLVLANVSYGIWQSWWLSSLTLAAAATLSEVLRIGAKS